MFVYDPEFLGDSHSVTIAIAVGCLIGSIFMFKYQLKLQGWGPQIRMSISTVVVLACFLCLAVFMIVKARKKPHSSVSKRLT